MIGAGIFSMPGIIAASAGPGGILSFTIAGLFMLAVARCYERFSQFSPGGVSAYSFVYTSLGELAAVIVGGGLFVEYFFGASAIAQAWAQYLIIATGIGLPKFLQGSTMLADGSFRFGFNIVATSVIAFITVTICLTNVRSAALVNTALVVLKLTLLGVFLFVGFKHFQIKNLFPFMPFGVQGVMAGAALAVFPYVGFDQLYSFVKESKREKDTSIATYLSVILSGILYICVMLIMLGVVSPTVSGANGDLVANPIYKGNEAASALAGVLSAVKESTVAKFISVAAVIGLLNVLLVGGLSTPRVFKNMAEDGLLPPVFARTHKGTPIAGTIITGSVIGILSGLVPFQQLAHMMVLGTLVGFVAISMGAKKEKLVSWVVALFVTISGIFLMTRLDHVVFMVYAITVTVALTAYFCYGYKNSKLNVGEPSL